MSQRSSMKGGRKKVRASLLAIEESFQKLAMANDQLNEIK